MVLFYHPTKTSADEPIIVPQECPGTIQQKVNCYADKYGVDRKLANYIVKNESGYDPLNKSDMGITCRYKNSPYYSKPVEARGLMQITKCYYPSVTDVQAYNPDFNLDFGMKIIAQGKSVCRSQFTTCNNYYKKAS